MVVQNSTFLSSDSLPEENPFLGGKKSVNVEIIFKIHVAVSLLDLTHMSHR